MWRRLTTSELEQVRKEREPYLREVSRTGHFLFALFGAAAIAFASVHDLVGCILFSIITVVILILEYNLKELVEEEIAPENLWITEATVLRVENEEYCRKDKSYTLHYAIVKAEENTYKIRCSFAITDYASDKKEVKIICTGKEIDERLMRILQE